eukprot:COSAG02_NODE_7596_length_2943_cov_4.723980_2_plen_57_part_00
MTLRMPQPFLADLPHRVYGSVLVATNSADHAQGAEPCEVLCDIEGGLGLFGAYTTV